jgi:hypothetical protein
MVLDVVAVCVGSTPQLHSGPQIGGDVVRSPPLIAHALLTMESVDEHKGEGVHTSTDGRGTHLHRGPQIDGDVERGPPLIAHPLHRRLQFTCLSWPGYRLCWRSEKGQIIR